MGHPIDADGTPRDGALGLPTFLFRVVVTYPKEV